MSKINCWEFKKCGREPGGANIDELGACPAATLAAANGFCGGKNGGRACAYITGTYCSGVIQGTSKEKEKNCECCDFYKELKKEHGSEMYVTIFSKYVKEREDNV